jgi:hypothetical protein
MICPASAESICCVIKAALAGSMPAWPPLSISDGGITAPCPCDHRGDLTRSPWIGSTTAIGEAAPLGSTSRGAALAPRVKTLARYDRELSSG